MSVLIKSSLTTAISEPSLIHCDNFIASFGPHLSLEGISLTVASIAMDIKDESLSDRRVNGVSISLQHDFFSILHHSQSEKIFFRPCDLDVLRQGVFFVNHIKISCF